ncbi:MAG: hypothetical protein ACT443_06805 [Gemmatimonadota bacterium]
MPITLLLALVFAGCGGIKTAPPMPGAASAPSLRAATVMVFPVQNGTVPSAEAGARHWPVERAALDAEIAYWLQQGAQRARWLLPETIDRTLARSPALNLDPRALAVGSFQRAQVRRIGDPLFGDLARLAAVLNANVALIPVAAEFVGADAATAVLNIATAVIDPTDGDVIWFGVITGVEPGAGNHAAVATAAQAFARAFGGQPAGDK